MDRRQYLRRVAAGATLGTAATAGCAALGGSGGGSGNANTILPKPDLSAAPEKYPFTQWSQKIPEATVPAALQDRTVTTTEFDTPLALTFIYTNCQSVCPILTLALQRAQQDAIDGGYADAVHFAEISFDPARDTPDAFRAYADERHVNLDADDWYFLRPKSEQRAREVVHGKFGLFFEKKTPTPKGTANASTANASATATTAPGTPTGTATEPAPETGTATETHSGSDHGSYMFTHSTLILLVNSDNYVERAYRDRNAAVKQLTKDVQTLLDA